MRSAPLGGMPAAMALSFAVHAAALAGGLLLVGWERAVEPEAITVELVTLPAEGSPDGSAADRPSPRPDEAQAEPAAEPEPAPLVAAAPEQARPVAPPEEAQPAPPPETVVAAPAPQAEVMAAVTDKPVAQPPVPQAKPAPPLMTAAHSLPSPSPSMGEGGVGVTGDVASNAPAANGGEGPARGLSRDAMSLPGNPAPVYPLIARRQGIEGQVILRLLVTPGGDPAEVTVRQSSGHAALDRSALEAVRRWRFRPALRGGRPVDAVIDLPVTFRLDG